MNDELQIVYCGMKFKAAVRSLWLRISVNTEHRLTIFEVFGGYN